MKYKFPPIGTNYSCKGDSKIERLTEALKKIVCFLQKLENNENLVRYDDWWEHDGLYFKKGIISFSKLLSIIDTPKSLCEHMPGDFDVFIGISNRKCSWYLRFYVDWDENDENLEGRFDITVSKGIIDNFENEVINKIDMDFEICSSSS